MKYGWIAMSCRKLGTISKMDFFVSRRSHGRIIPRNVFDVVVTKAIFIYYFFLAIMVLFIKDLPLVLEKNYTNDS